MHIDVVCIYVMCVYIYIYMPIPVAAQSKACVYSRLSVSIVGSNPAGGMDIRLLWMLSAVR